jgi:hypothetical protein
VQVDIAAEFTDQTRNGVGESGIKPGIIGDLGCWSALTDAGRGPA